MDDVEVKPSEIEVLGDFFRLPNQWQREYRPLLAGWFVGRHRELIDALDRER